MFNKEGLHVVCAPMIYIKKSPPKMTAALLEVSGLLVVCSAAISVMEKGVRHKQKDVPFPVL